MRPYVIRQGDHLTALAARFGFDAEEVWQHDANRELRQQRENPGVLAPGDLIHLPEFAATTVQLRAKTRNRYSATQPRVRLALVLQAGGSVLANEPYVVHGAGAPIEGTSDGHGHADISVPARVPEIRIELRQHATTMIVQIGHLDPVEHESGVRSRLVNLSFLVPRGTIHPSLARAMSSQMRDEELREAVIRFQRDAGIDATGELNDETRRALRDRHGS